MLFERSSYVELPTGVPARAVVRLDDVTSSASQNSNRALNFGILVIIVESAYPFFQIFSTKSFVDLVLVTTPKGFSTDGRN